MSLSMNKSWKAFMSLAAAVHVITLYGCAATDPSKNVSGTAAETSVTTTAKPVETTQVSALSAETLNVQAKGTYELAGGNASKQDEEILSETDGQSAILVSTGGKLNASKLKAVTTGKTPSEAQSLKDGLNAAVLVQASSELDMSDSEVVTSGVGAGGIFATGTNAALTLNNMKISTAGIASPGLSLAEKASGMVQSAQTSTEGDRSPGVLIGPGGGTLSLLAGNISTAGADSPGVRSSGVVTLTGTSVTASRSEAAVLNGNSTVTFTGVKASASGENSVRILSDNTASPGSAVFNMVSGSLDSLNGSLFYVYGSAATINLNSVQIKNPSEILLTVEAAVSGTGEEAVTAGANATLSMDNIITTGEVKADMYSTVDLNLKNGTVYTGAVNTLCSAKEVNLTMDAGSKWILTGDSYVTTLNNALAQLTNIQDGGFHIYYEKSNPSNSWLEGKTIALSGGGTITPNLSRGEGA